MISMLQDYHGNQPVAPALRKVAEELGGGGGGGGGIGGLWHFFFLSQKKFGQFPRHGVGVSSYMTDKQESKKKKKEVFFFADAKGGGGDVWTP